MRKHCDALCVIHLKTPLRRTKFPSVYPHIGNRADSTVRYEVKDGPTRA